MQKSYQKCIRLTGYLIGYYGFVNTVFIVINMYDQKRFLQKRTHDYKQQKMSLGVICLTKHGKSHLCEWLYISFIYLFVKVSIPHVIDGAARSSHQQSTCTKQGEYAQMWEASRVSSQSNAPCAREVQQPCPYKTQTHHKHLKLWRNEGQVNRDSETLAD